MMLKSILNVLLAAWALHGGAARAESSPNTLTEPERRSGWRLLFNGTSLDAFRGYRQTAVPAGWVVEDGALVRKAARAGDLITKNTFEHFELLLDYRIAHGGNSGLMFHVTEAERAPWMTGPEVQILDNAAGRDPQKAGWLYQLYAPRKPDWLVDVEVKAGRPRHEWLDATRPAGEWNQLYLRVAPDSGEVCLNGVSYCNFRKGDEEWVKRVAASKFKAFAEFGKATRGHVCLQDHGDEVAFRSIKVRELDANGAPLGVTPEDTLALQPEPAFPGITWEGWAPENDDGTPAEPLRPLTVTHAGDGTGRRFVLDQSGMIHVVPRELPTDKRQARLFLDDPLRTAQRLDTLLGKILRIDVDRRDAGKTYAVPADNPFVGRAAARPEIFAFGFRNPWQIAFDRATGRLWTADVGQDLREEIDIVEKGGNYGWSLREGSGPFGPVAVTTPSIDPVWEYDHRIGKSITGGFVVRGSPLAALEGSYLYGDYVSGKLWALRPNDNPREIVNASVPWNGLPVFGFGQDEAGEVYVLTSSATGQGVFRLAAGETPR